MVEEGSRKIKVGFKDGDLGRMRIGPKIEVFEDRNRSVGSLLRYQTNEG